MLVALRESHCQDSSALRQFLIRRCFNVNICDTIFSFPVAPKFSVVMMYQEVLLSYNALRLFPSSIGNDTAERLGEWTWVRNSATPDAQANPKDVRLEMHSDDSLLHNAPPLLSGTPLSSAEQESGPGKQFSPQIGSGRLATAAGCSTFW